MKHTCNKCGGPMVAVKRDKTTYGGDTSSKLPFRIHCDAMIWDKEKKEHVLCGSWYDAADAKTVAGGEAVMQAPMVEKDRRGRYEPVKQYEDGQWYTETIARLLGKWVEPTVIVATVKTKKDTRLTPAQQAAVEEYQRRFK